MGIVMTGASMSLDGYIAGPEETGFERLFAWYGNGDVETPTADPAMTFRTSAASAEHLKWLDGELGALVVGRRLYDLTHAWGGRHPSDLPVVVLTHRLPADRPAEDENFVFVTGGIEAAVARARELAGDRSVGLNGGSIARQALEAGLLDEVHVDLVPVLLGGGVPFFGALTGPVDLEGPCSSVQGDRVTHLRFRVAR